MDFPEGSQVIVSQPGRESFSGTVDHNLAEQDRHAGHRHPVI